MSNSSREPFLRRYYPGPGEFFRDLGWLLRRRQGIKRAMSGDLISKAFRERLMMVVTEVNDCRYCRSFHVPQAANSGVGEEEIQDILAGQMPADAPVEEHAALAYAQHWAEENARPDPVYRRQVQERYAGETFAAVEMILRMIRVGNLTGNSLDFILDRISGGRWGGGSRGKQSGRRLSRRTGE
jgi:AhpD family alkylhydroperoxidase